MTPVEQYKKNIEGLKKCQFLRHEPSGEVIVDLATLHINIKQSHISLLESVISDLNRELKKINAMPENTATSIFMKYSSFADGVRQSIEHQTTYLKDQIEQIRNN